VEWMLDTKRFEKRNPAMDIIRIVAAFTVLSVHFFLNNGFYYETVQGAPMYIMSLMRTLFSVCVPLFLILTGYLMSHKTLSKSYYKGISKTLIIFVLATLACMLFKTFYKGDEFSLSKFILGTLDFTGANYSWYIEMYIGLFLIAPFLNLV
jgi:surface polysaccharide O-acyltransferase-like enzyme